MVQCREVSVGGKCFELRLELRELPGGNYSVAASRFPVRQRKGVSSLFTCGIP